jgi:lysophospholipase L1-like esterase
MKALQYTLWIMAGLLSMPTAWSQKKIDSSYNNTYYQGRMELFRSVGGLKKAIVFLGNSITERGQWHELLPGKVIMNRGIGGDNTFGVLARLDSVLLYQPKKIFLLIGINDIGRGLPVAVIAENYRRIVQRIRTVAPKTTLYVQSVLPMNDAVLKAEYLKNKKDTILQLNKAIIEVANNYQLQYLNLHEVFADEQGDLKKMFTMDGIHLNPAAYVVWVDYLKKKKYL